MSFIEYIWLDGSAPTQGLRAKTRVVTVNPGRLDAEDLPEWSFDGSSTGQASGSNSDCALQPVSVVRDPIRGGDNWLALCEMLDADGASHRSNTRAVLRTVLDAGADKHEAWIGFEQEYTLLRDARPLGFPKDGFPAPQGPYYCSVDADRAFGRAIAEEHAQLCQDAGLIYFGLNAEVMPGQWEFQIGYRGVDGDDPSLLNVCDHLWLARYLLQRVAERHGVTASFDNKPMKGDWNGAGLHTNFSSARMRAEGGVNAIYKAMKRLERSHAQHISVYGERLEERLTGLHETCSITQFKAGDCDRGASIRIPLGVKRAGAGYFEDRRPGANADPYRVAARLAATVFDIDDADAARIAAA
ncbi:MAG: glutamine synthetase [Alphaproteobacteria bacterium]|nr:glutamine synthetase [Alphaproteobacteria bacterium]